MTDQLHARLAENQAVIESATRFWSQVEKTNECWNWLGSLESKGYGQVRWDGRNQKAHRVSYEMSRGKIPKGMVIDHLCRNRVCVNPSHMEVVTNKVNVLRGLGVTSLNYRKTECMRGHPLEGENLYTPPSGYGRYCKECRKDASRRFNANRKAREAM